MKFSEIAIVILMITLSVTALNSLNIIPIAVTDSTESYSMGDINMRDNSYTIVNGTITCSDDAYKDDIMCKITYLNQSSYSNVEGLTDTTDLFGFSDIIRGVQMLSEVLGLATYRVGDLFDYFIKPCYQYEYNAGTGNFVCARRNVVYDIKYLFLFPIYLVYLFALFETITGRNISGDK